MSNFAKSCRNIVFFGFIGICSLCFNFMILQHIYSEINRIILAQRLELSLLMSRDEINYYFDCEYAAAGIHVSELLWRVSRVDTVLVNPPSEYISFQSEEIELDLTYPNRGFIVYYDHFSSLNRKYSIDEQGIIKEVSEVPSYYGTEPIVCK